MIEFGCLAHFKYPHAERVAFAKETGFSFLQVWYDRNGLSLFEKDRDPVEVIRSSDFPSIIHAVLDINEYRKHIPRLVEILKQLNHSEIIIHPVCESESIDGKTIIRLIDEIRYAHDSFRESGITLHVENNSRLDPILNSSEEVGMLFDSLPDAEFLLDLAHIDGYDHLRRLVEVKYPKIIHLADRHLEKIHEHLPIGEGDIDFEMIFRDILPCFAGRIILEITQNNAKLVDSKRKIAEYSRGK
jgi:sugar phosphate isomerase/epimerase